MKASDFYFIFILMFFLAICVQVFALETVEGDMTEHYPFTMNFAINEQGSEFSWIPYIGGVLQFTYNLFMSIVSFVLLIVDILTFSILSPVSMPLWLSSISFLMILPCTVAVILWLIPILFKLGGLISKFAHAIAEAIPF